MKDSNIKYYKNFGLITNDQIIFQKGSSQEQISINSIDKVQLIKHRIYYSNFAIAFFGILGVLSIWMFFEPTLYVKITCGILASITLLLTIMHKFSLYVLKIKTNKDKTIELKTNQLNRSEIKSFYFDIVKEFKLEKRKSKINLSA